MALDRDAGITLPSGDLIPWAGIEHVERRRGLSPPPFDLESWGHWTRDLSQITSRGLCSVHGMLAMLTVTALMGAVLLAHVAVTSVLLTLSPWPATVVLHLRNQERVRLVDVEDPARFVRAVRAHLDGEP